MRWREAVNLLGAIGSLVGVVVLIFDLPVGWRVVLAAFVVIAILWLAYQVLPTLQPTLRPMGREAMVSTGQKLVREAKRTAVLFGSDMSWATDYIGAIQDARRSSKDVVVVYPRSESAVVAENAGLLSDAGARMVATSADPGFRGVLVDPEDDRDAVVFVALRQRKKGALNVPTGHQGSESSYEYVGKIYGLRRDWVLVKAICKIYEVMSQSAEES
jgi:hypothetical protein